MGVDEDHDEIIRQAGRIDALQALLNERLSALTERVDYQLGRVVLDGESDKLRREERIVDLNKRLTHIDECLEEKCADIVRTTAEQCDKIVNAATARNDLTDKRLRRAEWFIGVAVGAIGALELLDKFFTFVPSK